MHPSYSSYKNSEDEWLDDIPSHWDTIRTKYMLNFKKKLVGERANDFTLLSLTLNGVIPRDIESGKGKFPAEFNAYQVVSKKDLIFCLFDIDETPRTIGLSSHKGMITGAYNVYKCTNRCVPEYAYYYFLHIDSFKGLRPFYTGLRKVVRADTFAHVKMPEPPEHEQKQIADFLNHETAKIDTLIEKSERLISLLREKRQAMINHAVTKGINPNVPMKDSGIEWLGEIPKHWEVKKGRYIGLLCGSCSGSEVNEGEGSKPFVKVNDLNDFDGGLLEKTNSRIVPTSGYFPRRKNFLVFPKRGAAIFTNKVSIAPKDVVLDPNLMGWELFDNMNDLFVLMLLKSRTLDDIADVSTVPQINNKHIYPEKFPVPPTTEQDKIVEYLESKTGKIDDLIDKSQQQIEKLKEHRSALISAAVTGKIDVREWNKKEKAA